MRKELQVSKNCVLYFDVITNIFNYFTDAKFMYVTVFVKIYYLGGDTIILLIFYWTHKHSWQSQIISVLKLDECV